MLQLITVSRAKQAPALANLNSTYLSNLITAASAYIENYCDRVFNQATYAGELRDGNGLTYIYCENYPLTTLTSIIIRDTSNSSETISGSNFDINEDNGKISFVPGVGSAWGVFVQGTQNITIAYTGGYETIPGDLQEATVQVVMNMYAPGAANNIGVKKERLGEYSIERDTGSSQMMMTPLVESLLRPYVRMYHQ